MEIDMTYSYELEPFYNVGAGDLLKDEIEYRQWTVKDFAEKLDLPIAMTENILNNNIEYTKDIASRIESVIGVPSDVWISMDQKYRMRKNKKTKPVYSPAPVRYIKEM